MLAFPKDIPHCAPQSRRQITVFSMMLQACGKQAHALQPGLVQLTENYSRRLDASINIFKTHDVVFAKVLAALHFDHDQVQ